MIKQNAILNGMYKISHVIGKGGTGVVYLAWHMNLQKYVVIKQQFLRNLDETALRKEADILKNLHHQYLPQVYDFFIYEGTVCTAMDYIDGVDLEKYPPGIRNLSEQQITTWLRQMADVLGYLNSNNPPVIHSDIKPANVIITRQNNVCLIDFNISVVEGRARVQGYSENYASPEQVTFARQIISGREPEFDLDTATDIYSTGALFYTLMSGRKPVSTQLNTPLTQLRTGYSEELCSLVDQCMAWNRDKRFKNGNQLKKAIESLKKRSSEYRNTLMLNIASLVFSLSLIGIGIFCIIHGTQLERLSNFNQEYAAFSREVDSGDYESITNTGLSILNNESYRSILEDSTEKADIMHAIGDAEYAKEDYSSASYYYNEALKLKESAYFYLDYAMASLMNSDTSTAQSALTKAQSYGADNASVNLINAGIAYKNGDSDTALSNIQQAVQQSGDLQLLSSAYDLAVKIEEERSKYSEAVKWARECIEKTGDINMERKLASLYMEAASDARLSPSQKKTYAENARNQYQKLTSSPSANESDYLNLAIVLQYMGRYDESLIPLQHLYKNNRNDFRISMYMAFAYAELNQESESRKYAMEAFDLYTGNPGAVIDEYALGKLEEIKKGW